MDRPFTSVHQSLLVALCLLLVISLVVGSSGCATRGQSTAWSREAKETRTLEIAADYARDHDLDRAQARLDELNVANATQWVAMLAERHIAEGRDEDVARPLASLAQALGCNSEKIARYLATPTPLPTATPTAEPTPITPPPTPTLELPTPTPIPPTPTPAPPTPTPPPQPYAVVKGAKVNVRSGPGTAYSPLGAAEEGQRFDIVARNETGDWWQICCLAGKRGWIYAPLVEAGGATEGVAVAANIPPPPTPTPSPPTATPMPTKPAVDYRIVSQRLLSVEENGGFHAGYSVNCGEKHEIRILVLDAAGNPLNGVVVAGRWNSNPPQVTGSKGPGRAEFIIHDTNSGDEIYVLRDPDGREVTSEVGISMTSRPEDIPRHMLEEAGYCTESGKCDDPQQLYLLCRGHHSWEIIFQRTW